MRLQRTLQLILFTVAIILALQTACPVQAQAEQTFAVAPFSINGPSKYAYLQKGIQDMFNSRLSWTDHFRPIGRTTVDKGIGSATVSSDNAQKMIVRLGCDYLIYGSVTIMGDQCSLDVRVTGRDGQTWPKTAQTSLDNLIPAFTRVANSINGEVFKKPGSEVKTGEEKAGPHNRDRAEKRHEPHADSQSARRTAGLFESSVPVCGRRGHGRAYPQPEHALCWIFLCGWRYRWRRTK